MTSVIFQGAFSEEVTGSLGRSIARIKGFAPEVQVIISTWRSCRVPALGQDSTVYSDDLPSYTPPGFKACNLHRQIASTAAGISLVSTGPCAKLRTDVEVIDVKRFIAALHKKRSIGRAFNEQIAVIDYSTVDPLRNNMPLAYHVCDWIFIGDRDDLWLMFSAPLPAPDFFSFYKEREQGNRRLKGYAEAMRAESYLAAYAVRKTYWRQRSTPAAISKFEAMRSNIEVAENFEITTLSSLGLLSTRHKIGGFNPNRYTASTAYLWRRIPKTKRLRLWRKILISAYYLQRPILSTIMNIATVFKTMVNRATSD